MRSHRLIRCKKCGKRIPQRNNQVNFACQRLGLCRGCYLDLVRWLRVEAQAIGLSREEALEEFRRRQEFDDQWQEYLEHWPEGGEDDETADNN